MLYYEEKGENPEDMMITPGYDGWGLFLGFTPKDFAGYIWHYKGNVIMSDLRFVSQDKGERLRVFGKLISAIRENDLVPVVTMCSAENVNASRRLGMTLSDMDLGTGNVPVYIFGNKKNWIRQLFGS